MPPRRIPAIWCAFRGGEGSISELKATEEYIVTVRVDSRKARRMRPIQFSWWFVRTPANGNEKCQVRGEGGDASALLFSTFLADPFCEREEMNRRPGAHCLWFLLNRNRCPHGNGDTVCLQRAAELAYADAVTHAANGSFPRLPSRGIGPFTSAICGRPGFPADLCNVPATLP